MNVKNNNQLKRVIESVTKIVDDNGQEIPTNQKRLMEIPSNKDEHEITLSLMTWGEIARNSVHRLSKKFPELVFIYKSFCEQPDDHTYIFFGGDIVKYYEIKYISLDISKSGLAHNNRNIQRELINLEIFNQVLIKGNDEEVKQVFEYIEGEPDDDGREMYIDFDKIVRMPDNIKYLGNFCYDWLEKDEHPYKIWCKSNWECIGKAYDQKLESNNIISFYTKGAPAIKLIALLSQKFRDVHFVYYSHDGNKSEYFNIRNGACKQEVQWESEEIVFHDSLDPKSKLKFIKDKLNLK